MSGGKNKNKQITHKKQKNKKTKQKTTQNIYIYIKQHKTQKSYLVIKRVIGELYVNWIGVKSFPVQAASFFKYCPDCVCPHF
jgi:hypothetical protein